MRVVFLTHNYPRDAGDVAGAFLHPLARALAARNHDVRVVAPSDRGAGGQSTLDGIPVERVRYAAPAREIYAYSGRMQEALRSPAGWLALGRMIRAMGQAAARLAAGDPQAVVHAHWWFPAGFAAPEGPCVVTLHGTDAQLLRKPGAAWLAQRALRPGRIVTAVSSHVAALVERVTGRPVDASHQTPMPVDLPSRRSTGGGGLVVLGRLTAQKRVDLALRAHARLVAGGRKLPLRVIGDGPARHALQALAASLGTGLVSFAGQVPPAAVPDLLSNADLMLFPAVGEGLGLAAIEALACGVPVVACRDGGGLLDIVGSGAAAPPSPEGIEAAAALLLDDPAARARAEAAGARFRVDLAPARVAERCEAWYREALGE